MLRKLNWAIDAIEIKNIGMKFNTATTAVALRRDAFALVSLRAFLDTGGRIIRWNDTASRTTNKLARNVMR